MGFPSPAAGITLATYYWFSQTPLYNQTVILFTDSIRSRTCRGITCCAVSWRCSPR